jgi:hypothetical protein
MSRTPTRPTGKTNKTASNVAAATPVRNTPIPKVATPAPATARKDVTRDMIAKRAYEISRSDRCGTEMENWLRAERELRGN